MMHCLGYNGVGMGFGGLFMILFWGVIILSIISIVKKNSSSGKKETAGDILNKRYARGEISHDEFEAMRKDLNK